MYWSEIYCKVKVKRCETSWFRVLAPNFFCNEDAKQSRHWQTCPVGDDYAGQMPNIWEMALFWFHIAILSGSSVPRAEALLLISATIYFDQ